MIKTIMVTIDDDDNGRAKISVMEGEIIDEGFVGVEADDPVAVMPFLCEALCALIHVAEADGLKTSTDSLRSCIGHLENGTFDASYKKGE